MWKQTRIQKRLCNQHRLSVQLAQQLIANSSSARKGFFPPVLVVVVQGDGEADETGPKLPIGSWWPARIRSGIEAQPRIQTRSSHQLCTAEKYIHLLYSTWTLGNSGLPKIVCCQSVFHCHWGISREIYWLLISLNWMKSPAGAAGGN